MSRRKKPRLRKPKRPPVEERLAQYLVELDLIFKQHQRIGRYNVDFLLPDQKLIIECYGDFFHCSPKKFAPDDFNKVLGCDAQTKWEKDKKREQHLKQRGYRFLVLWESEIDYHSQFCKRRIKDFLN